MTPIVMRATRFVRALQERDARCDSGTRDGAADA